MRIVVALGSNALLRRGEPMTAANQRRNVQVACEQLAPIAQHHELVISHGNGPQISLLALEEAAFEDGPDSPLDVLGAETQGMIGYVIEQELSNRLPAEKPLASVLTMIEVDPADPAFGDPTKPIGPRYSPDEVARLGAERGWTFNPDGDLLRRVVPLPGAQAHRRAPAHRLAARPRLRGHLRGWGRHSTAYDANGQRAIVRAHPDALLAECAGEFPAGSMLPRVLAACDFARATGRPAVIGALGGIEAMLDGTAGTRVTTEHAGVVRGHPVIAARAGGV